MKKNTTKRSLLASVLALVMCVTMLVGTTFAWFTDSASVSVSKIEAGKLDIDVYYADVIEPKEDTVWTQLTENSELSFLRKDGEKLVQEMKRLRQKRPSLKTGWSPTAARSIIPSPITRSA